MTSADELFQQAAHNYQRLGIEHSPFTESPSGLESQTLQQVFTGRTHELKQVFNQFQSRERRRILVFGRIGIGKSAFLLEVLGTLRRQLPQMLTTYISLPANLDLATTALIALAQAMPKDDWAQKQLYQMGIRTDQIQKKRTATAGAKMVFEGTFSEEDLPTNLPKYPTFSLDKLLKQAQKQYPRGVLIAIDDLDKQNPRRVRELMHDAQGMLKGPAWFMLTGHPYGMTGDLLTSERGLFDLQLELQELDHPTTYQMLINYLNSVRIGQKYDQVADPRSVLPFSPEAAQKFCQASLGKPRLFNRLGNIVLSTAANLEAQQIDLNILDAGLKEAKPALLQQAALSAQEERVRMLLEDRGSLGDDTISLDDLQQLGFRSYSEIFPILERLEAADLAHQLPQADATVFKSIPLPPAEDPPQ